MRKIELEVPAELFADFTDKLEETGLDNRVVGKNDDDEIVVEVHYDKADVKTADELEQWVEQAKDDYYDSDEDEDDEDDDR